ncbi:MAG: hypothetical protein AB7L17_07655 [Ilumatobacteraceae bacterium]
MLGPTALRRAARTLVVAATIGAWIGIGVTDSQQGASADAATCADGTSTADLNRLFAGQVDEYVGLDALRAHQLPDGRVLWLFQDAFFVPGGGRADDLGSAHFAHNAALVQTGACFRAIHGPTSPGDRCPNPGRASYVGGEQTLNCNRWFWPMGGAIGADGALHVFYALVGNISSAGAGTGAAPDGVWIARIDPDDLSVASLRPAPDDDGRVLYGWTVETAGEHTYLFGHSYDQFNLPDPTSPPAEDTFLARIPRGRFDLAPEYWDGHGWTDVRRDAAAIHAGPAGQTYALQPRLIDGVWVSVTKPGDWFGSDLAVDTAPAPQGPWTRVRTITVPAKTSDGSTNTYLPHLLPWRSALGNLVVTVSHNAWRMDPDAFSNPRLYRPTFFEIEPPEPIPRIGLTPSTDELGFLPTSPHRALDTRTSTRLAAGAIRRVPLAALLAPGAQVAAVDLVGVDASGPGYITAWSCDEPRPWASNVNVSGPAPQAAFALVRVSSNAEICLFSSTAVDVVVDVFGSYISRHASGASSFRSVGPRRVLDTRTTRKVEAGRPERIQLEPGTTAVAVNVAATEADADGYVTAYPCDGPVPDTSNVNVRAGETVSNFAQVAVSPGDGRGGELCLVSSMRTHLVVDVTGAFSAGPGDSAGGSDEATWYRATAPTRLVDSRDGVGVPVGPMLRSQFGRAAVPANEVPALTAIPPEARALVVNAIAVDPAGDGWLAVAPCRDDAAYSTVVVNATAGQTTANMSVVPTRAASGRDVCMFSMMAAHHVLDLAGWYAPAEV